MVCIIPCCKKIWLLDVSNGIEQVFERRGDQIDNGYEGGHVAVASGPWPEPDTSKLRQCLRCRTNFQNDWAGERICSHCITPRQNFFGRQF